MMWPQKTIMIFFLMIFRSLAVAAPTKSPVHNLGIYLGQNSGEGTIASVCATGKYSHIILSSLTNFGSGRVPKLNLTGLCDPTTNTCNLSISDHISFCQQLGIKVILSLDTNYSISSTQDALNVSHYLNNTYLRGRGKGKGKGRWKFRPFGKAVLDGIHFNIDQGSDLKNYDDLVTNLSKYDNVYLGATHRCPPPPGTSSIGSANAINTELFDFVTIESNNRRQCDYNGIPPLVILQVMG